MNNEMSTYFAQTVRIKSSRSSAYLFPYSDTVTTEEETQHIYTLPEHRMRISLTSNDSYDIQSANLNLS